MIMTIIFMIFHVGYAAYAQRKHSAAGIYCKMQGQVM